MGEDESDFVRKFLFAGIKAALNSRVNFFPLPEVFYTRSAKIVARQLLGHWLIRQIAEGCCGGAIVETEAYLQDDPACHASRGETARNRPMFGPPGRAYVYFIYGNHWCFNAVTNRVGVGEAVLVRAIEPLFGKEFMRTNRAVAKPHELTNGPAKFCEAMDIDRRLNHANLCETKSPIFIAENPSRKKFLKEQGPIVTTTRIGIRLAAHLPLRFYLENSEFVSRR